MRLIFCQRPFIPGASPFFLAGHRSSSVDGVSRLSRGDHGESHGVTRNGSLSFWTASRTACHSGTIWRTTSAWKLVISGASPSPASRRTSYSVAIRVLEFRSFPGLFPVPVSGGVSVGCWVRRRG